MTEEELTGTLQDLINLNQSLIQRQQGLEDRVRQMEQSRRDVLDYLSVLTDKIKQYNDVADEVNRMQVVQELLQGAIRNMRYELADISDRHYFHPRIMSEEETVDRIIDEHKSIARFGDGEFGLIFGESRMYFQEEDAILGERLHEVLNSNEQDLMIGIVDVYGSLEQFTEATQYAWRRFLTPEYRSRMEQLLSAERLYANARITRPYAEQSDMHTDAPAKRFARLKQIWCDQRVVIIEGSKTGMGVGNDLFDGARELRRIVCPAENAFCVYDQILQAARSIEQDCLILLALGPTATVLAYDLCKAGYWVLDIGHIDLEYEWFLHQTGGRTRISGKYVNEVADGQDVSDIHNEAYDDQVIYRIGC